MAWLEDDSAEGYYILTTAGKEKIFASTNSSYLFFCMSNLKSIENIELLDTSKVTNMEGMFLQCISLEELDLNKLDTGKVTNMYRIFGNCEKLKKLNLSSFDTSSVTSMTAMFDFCYNLTISIDITNKNMQSFANMFGDAATKSPAQITVNYTSETSSLVDSMIATKSSNSNVVKGVQID